MSTFIKLLDYDNAKNKEHGIFNKLNYYKANSLIFSRIPGNPIAYWVSEALINIFADHKRIENYLDTAQGMKTLNNDLFIKSWFELEQKKSSIFNKVNAKWFPLNHGGEYKKWYGNNECLIDWENDGENIKKLAKKKYNSITRTVTGMGHYFKSGVSWSAISMKSIGARYFPKGFIFSNAGMCAFGESGLLVHICGLLNSSSSEKIASIICPTINIGPDQVKLFPVPARNSINEKSIKEGISEAKSDWDLRETSWDFLRSPLLTDYRANRIETVIDENLTDWSWPSAYRLVESIDLAEQVKSFKRHWTELFLELHKNEEENNRIFIDLYGLQDELTPDVPYSEITILQEELVESARKEGRIEFEESVLARQFVSYGVGCLVGRYSVEKDGLILADAGATLEDFIAKVPGARFLPDPDGILPLTDEDDFIDDLPTRFKAWLRFISGDRYEDNLSWIEERLGKDLRSYFIRDFYKEHLRRYKNRPIYWMVTSPSGAFRALLYLHRYTKDSVGKVLNDYLRPYRGKLEQKIRGLQSIVDSSSYSQGEKTKAKKRLLQLEKYQRELDLWEKDALYPAALARIELDLDDGVKVNYRKLGSILEPVKQLEAKEQE